MPSFILALVLTGTPADFPADELFATIKTNSAHRQKVDWKQVEAEYRQQIAKATTDGAKAKAVVAVFAKLNDVHSSLMYQGKYYAHYEGVDDATRQKLKPWMEQQRREAGKPTTQMLPGNIAYVRVPSYNVSGEAIQKAAVELYNKVSELQDQKPQG